MKGPPALLGQNGLEHPFWSGRRGSRAGGTYSAAEVRYRLAG